jgi:NAD(P)-dependent dehydrogenase (short-subunit alcohol dehydrogenase family)
MKSSNRSVLITGALGGIGQALCREFSVAGWHVLATDRAPRAKGMEKKFLPLDLLKFAKSARQRNAFAIRVRAAAAAAGAPLAALINNAAIQRLNPTAEVTAEDWETTLAVNLVAPFLLAQTFLPDLERASGAIVNLGSIHEKLTKPEFVVYATSKAAMAGMTRAMAVDLGARVRVNAINPAAISTPMMEAGFASKPKSARRSLDQFHPVGRIGRPEEVAQLALYLASNQSAFLTGSVIGLDGGIASRLHDPV